MHEYDRHFGGMLCFDRAALWTQQHFTGAKIGAFHGEDRDHHIGKQAQHLLLLLKSEPVLLNGETAYRKEGLLRLRDAIGFFA
ncbi:hypothetical protein D3C86_2028890 [compost metagenome]